MPTPNSTLVEPRLIRRPFGNQGQQQQQQLSEDLIECSIHTLPKPLLREFRHVFGEKYMQDVSSGTNDMMMDDNKFSTSEILAIPTNQHARENLVAVGDNIELEKDRLLNVFIDFGRDLCTKLRSLGYWADYIDPCSGLPMLTRDCNKVYSEVDGMECLLNYKSYNAGFCKILTHPKWGSSVYPATIFVYGPKIQIIQFIQDTYPTVVQ